MIQIGQSCINFCHSCTVLHSYKLMVKVYTRQSAMIKDRLHHSTLCRCFKFVLICPTQDHILQHLWKIYIYAGHQPWWTYERWGWDILALIYSNLRQSKMDLGQFTNAGCRRLLLSMFKNNLRFSEFCTLICSHTLHLLTLSAARLSLNYVCPSVLICISRSADWCRLMQSSGMLP